MCYFINVSRQRRRGYGGEAIQICRVCVEFKQAGDIMRHLATTAFPPSNGYVMELFREDKACKRIDAPEPHNYVHL